MNKRTQIGLILLTTLVLLLGLTVLGQAKEDPVFFINYTFDEVDWDNYSATGIFDISTNQYREGTVAMSWIPGYHVKQGTMYFTDTYGESFAVKFTIARANAVECNSGSFQILAKEGTGVYEGKKGNGTIWMCLMSDGTLEGTLEGWLR
jgi:hypothetical protein